MTAAGSYFDAVIRPGLWRERLERASFRVIPDAVELRTCVEPAPSAPAVRAYTAAVPVWERPW